MKDMSNEVEAAADSIGLSTALMSVMMFVSDRLNVVNINQWLITVTSIGGIVWVVFKIRGQYLDNKLKQRELDKNN
jgi:hypothetical protein